MTLSLEALSTWLGQPSRRSKIPRTITHELTDCLIWTGAVSFQVPKAHVPGVARNVVNIRRLVLEAKLGRELPVTEIATYTCGDLRCLNPEHLAIASRLEIQQRTKAEGKWGPEKCSKRASDAAKTRIKHFVTKEQVREILIDVKRGVSPYRISKERGRALRTVRRILSWQIPEMLGMDRAYEEARLRADVAPTDRVHITVAPNRITNSRWVPGTPPPLFSSQPYGAFANGVQA
jgi:hypothetical protein